MFRPATPGGYWHRLWARQVSLALRVQLVAVSVQVAMQLARFGSILNNRARHSAMHAARFDSQAEAPTQASQFEVCAIAPCSGTPPAIRQAIATITLGSAGVLVPDRSTDARWCRLRGRRWPITVSYRPSLLPEVPQPGPWRTVRCGLPGPNR